MNKEYKELQEENDNIRLGINNIMFINKFNDEEKEELWLLINKLIDIEEKVLKQFN